MNKSGFKVIEGNVLITPEEAGGIFVSAEATKTRLMGVVGLHVVRKRESDEFHQFFYLDTEEYGLDDYQSMINPDPTEVKKKKDELYGALGGTWVSITEKEYLFLIRDYYGINKRRNLIPPEGFDEYKGVLSTNFTFSSEEKRVLWGKVCTEMHNDYELINYFVMRMIAKDNELLPYLSQPGGAITPFYVKNPGTLIKNEIIKGDKFDSQKSTHVYNLISLLDIDKEYMLLESEISVLGSKVIAYKPEKPMPISTWETANILNRPEYILHTRFEGDPEILKKIIFSVFSTVTESEYEFGSLFMVFRPNNNHVRKKVYRLDQDTLGIICLLETGEVTFSGSDTTELEAIETSIMAALMVENMKLDIIGSYKFPEPVLVRFIDSDFISFQDFMDFVQSFQTDD